MADFSMDRIQILLQQERYKDAEELLQGLYRNDPSDAIVVSLLAEVNLQSENYPAGHHFADEGLQIAPNNPVFHYLKGRLFLLEHNTKEASRFLDEAIQLDPEQPDFPAMKAAIALQQKDFETTLTYADRALELDAEHLLALNMRTTALQKLNRTEDAFLTIEGALREDPNNSYTHSNYGWNLLEAGNHKKALEHFKQALQNNPGNEHAKHGMIQAIKASNSIYRLFLKYSFFMTNLTSKYQWGVIIGFYIGFRLLRGLAESNEALSPFLMPIIILLAIFAFSTWIITPVSNLLFRLHPYGKFLLDKEEVQAANFVGLSLLLSIIGWIGYLITEGVPWIGIGFLGLTLTIPLSNMYTNARPKWALFWYPIGMALIGGLAVSKSFQSGELFSEFATAYLIALIAYQWIANAIMIRQDK